ncbi:RDD family protein [Alienimonas californiensis]|uniref:RDD family protein n=1 Tax=Alienimonas californiensis TaxID=2527989 RepID=A0A517P8A1_9PLAN|nr:RDD family protein [Alienimonas californiensis]QDT15597.1 RDD family protein [Alienimonas californiensis]
MAPPPVAANAAAPETRATDELLGGIDALGGAGLLGRAGTLRMRVETPENIVLELPLAGVTRRCGAWLIDTGIRAAILVAALLVIVPIACAGLGEFAFGAFLLLAFVSEWGYFTAFEAFNGGRTPGKALFGLRVVRTDGGPVTFWPALVRNLLRFADALPLMFTAPPHVMPSLLWPPPLPLYGLGALCCTLSPRGQRIGDLFAGTVVIRTHPATPPKQPVILDKIAPLDRALIAGPRPPRSTLATVDEYLARRGVLDHERGHQLALPLALAVARRLRYGGDPAGVKVYPMAFLARVWATYLRPEDDANEPDRGRR